MRGGKKQNHHVVAMQMELWGSVRLFSSLLSTFLSSRFIPIWRANLYYPEVLTWSNRSSSMPYLLGVEDPVLCCCSIAKSNLPIDLTLVYITYKNKTLNNKDHKVQEIIKCVVDGSDCAAACQKETVCEISEIQHPKCIYLSIYRGQLAGSTQYNKSN